MSVTSHLTKEEKKRLEAIEISLGWRYSNAVNQHIHDAGLAEAFQKAATKDEKVKQIDLGVKAMSHFGVDGTYYTLQNVDLFTCVARRVVEEQPIADLLKGRISTADAPLLEKCDFKTLAAIAKNIP